MPLREMNREQIWLLPPTLDELGPQDHPARFLDALDWEDWAEIGVGPEGDPLGAPAYHLRALLSAWLYGFMTNGRSYRKLEAACRDQIPYLITGRRVISSQTKASANRAAAALQLAATALHRSDSPGSLPAPEEGPVGSPKAITATAHKLARIIYSMLSYGQGYVDAGAQYYKSQYRKRALRAAKQRAAQLGYHLVPISDAHTSGVSHGSEVLTA